MIAEREAAATAYANNSAAGIYGISVRDYGTYIELSDQESEGKYYDVERLAKTLNISVTDAGLLDSRGKTYVFAKELTTGKVMQLFHPSLSCNSLSICISYPTGEAIASFNHNEWANAPYAGVLGQTENKNHFVC